MTDYVAVRLPVKIGELLVAQGWVEPAALARALAEQRHTGKRLCSLLISRGLLDPDNAARALATQHGVPGVLQKHLEQRDRSLARLLPPAVARAHTALPIGRARNQELILCVRDPVPGLAEQLAPLVGCAVIVAVAPAHQLEQLVKQTYDGMVSRPPPAAGSGELAAVPAADDDAIDVDLSTRPIPIIEDPLGNLGTMTLVGLDDHRVAKDPSQSGQHTAVPTLPPQPRTVTTPVLPRTSTPPPRASASTLERPGERTHPPSEPPRPSLPGPSIDATVAAIAQAGALDDATDAALWFLSQRFRRAVWFAIQDGFALGERGHGDALTLEMIQAITVPLSQPSIIQAAHDSRQLTTAVPTGTIQDRLSRTLGMPRGPAAVPIEVGARVAFVLVVGDASHAPDAAATELAALGAALGDAYDRL